MQNLFNIALQFDLSSITAGICLLALTLIVFKNVSIDNSYSIFGFCFKLRPKSPNHNPNHVDDLNDLNINKTIKKYFPSYTQYIVLQYGSTLRDPLGEHGDVDYIVLLIGTQSSKEKHILHEGVIPSIGSYNQYHDICFRDYISFIFGLISGLPYEHSVILWSKLRKGDLGKYTWLKHLANNIIIDRDFVLQLLHQKYQEELDSWKKYNEESDPYEIYRSGYYLASFLIQIIILKQMPKELRTKTVAQLAIASELADYIPDTKMRASYISLVYNLKRKTIPVSVKQFLNELKSLLDYLKNEGASHERH